MTPLEIFHSIWQQRCSSVLMVEAVNFSVNTNELPDIWAAAIYRCLEVTDVTFGSNPWVEETGEFGIGLFTRSGSGPASLDATVAKVRGALYGAALNGLHLYQVNGPVDIDPEADGEWWEVGLQALYTFQTRRNTRVDPLYYGWQGFPTVPTWPT
jgi:hypothetical protein